jgi:hypothetical protein
VSNALASARQTMTYVRLLEQRLRQMDRAAKARAVEVAVLQKRIAALERQLSGVDRCAG